MAGCETTDLAEIVEKLKEPDSSFMAVSYTHLLYPMVTFNGEECHNEWEITFEELHRNAAIVYAIYCYTQYTGCLLYTSRFADTQSCRAADGFMNAGLVRHSAGRAAQKKGPIFSARCGQRRWIAVRLAEAPPGS